MLLPAGLCPQARDGPGPAAAGGPGTCGPRMLSGSPSPREAVPCVWPGHLVDVGADRPAAAGDAGGTSFSSQAAFFLPGNWF